MRNPAWITESLQLFNSDQDVLIHGKELTGALIESDAAQKLLSKKYPHINGLQSPSLAALLQFNPTPTHAVQIHHTGKSAWALKLYFNVSLYLLQTIWCSCLGQVCTSNIGAKRGEILVMDSLAMQIPINRSMILQMAQIYWAPKNHSTSSVKVLPVQQQNGYRDCGLFAIAFATEICRGQDPSRAVFIQTQMRVHLLKCLTKGNMMPFPQFPQQETATLPPQITLWSRVNTCDSTLRVSFARPLWHKHGPMWSMWRKVPLLLHGNQKREIFLKCASVAIAHSSNWTFSLESQLSSKQSFLQLRDSE